jgi:TonB-dependent SusC/RagA subfamily outer membrane receptor
MKTKFKIVAIIFIIPLFCLGFIRLTNAEDPFISSLRNFIESFYKKKPWEKVYLHIDKTLYKPGEDVWFKVYATDAANTPSAQSDVVYVDLINPKGNIEKSLSLQLIQGVCFGNFTIDESFSGGIYTIKAYTNWMKNFGTDYIFSKEIQVQKVVYPRLLAKIDFKRETYSPGDTVSAELKVATLQNEPLSFKSVKVDFSLNGEKVTSSDLQTDNLGKAMLRFILPADLQTNDGLVNAKIQYEGSTEAISRSIPIVLNKIDISFFPEGGYMVANIPSNIGFKAWNEAGKPAEVEGYVTDDLQNKVAEFRSFHQGMGAFEFTPVPGKRYFAVVTKPHIAKTYELPEVMPKGFALRIVALKNNRYKVTCYSPVKEKIHLAVQAGKKLCFSQSEMVRNGSVEIEFNAEKFPSGVAMITMFDHNGTPRCERLAFFNYHKRMHISMKFDKEKYASREKVTLKIRTTDSDSIPTAANLSLSVVNDQLMTMADDKQDNILSWMLLGSEIKGKIEKPSFYFDPEEPKAEKALDYLLLTQGWRRYNWDSVQKGIYGILYPAEKIGTISGTIRDKRTGGPVKAEVIIVELQNRRRILRVNTGADGRFTFWNADASSRLQLLASSEEIDLSNLYLEVDNLNELANIQSQSKDNNGSVLIPDEIKVKAKIEENNEKIKKVKAVDRKENDIPQAIADEGEQVVMQADQHALEEVVVVGYGVQKKADLTGAVAIVNANEIQKLPLNIQQALQGRSAGLEVINDRGQAGAAPQMYIRGAASVSHNEPLLVIDGVIYDPLVSGNASVLRNISASDIESVSVLKDASATSVYGSKGANGVVVINTSKGYGFYKSIPKNTKPRYTGIMISPRQLSPTKEYYYPVYDDNDVPEVREDFRPTIYWNPNINTNNAGEATVEFYASDEITTFRAIAEGIGMMGDIGRSETKFHTQLPFSMAVKFPAYLTFGDTVIMPLIVKNNTSKPISGAVNIIVPNCLEPLQKLPDSLHVDANSTHPVNLVFFTKNIAGKDKIRVNFKGKSYRDAFIQEIDVQPKGFPTSVSVSGKEKEKTFSFTINKAVAGSVRAGISIFPNILSDLMSGVESILREPYGCFEQTSSSTYPNVMVLSYLKVTETENKEISDKALGLIKTGYNRLTSFETTERGYEWFGHAPAHDGLTAYGLMEFVDMEKVYNGVDRTMIERTLKWILAQRDGKGGFKRNTRALDGFGRASDEVTCAYIVYALSEAGLGEFNDEYNTAFAEAVKSKDPYRMNLMANAAFNLKKKANASELVDLLVAKTKRESWDKISIDHSITRSYGKSLQVETAALFTLALLKSANPDWLALENTINFMLSSRSYGGFGSTQATILALKALTAYTRFSAKTSSDGTIAVTINGTPATTYAYKKGDRGKIVLGGLEKYLEDGENTITVKFLDTDSPLPFTFDGGWNSSTPASDDKCKLSLKTSLATANSKVGETVRLNIQLRNITDSGLPMSMAVIGIPSGLSLQPWQLKELRDKQKVDFYELSKNYLVLYYRQMAPGELRDINLDLRAEIAGSYQAPASCTYLYYTNEYRQWVDGEPIRIEK